MKILNRLFTKVYEPPKTLDFIRVPLITKEEIEELKNPNLPKKRRELLEKLFSVEEQIKEVTNER